MRQRRCARQYVGGPTKSVIERWSHFAHDADIGICGVGESQAGAFEQAAIAMTRVVTAGEVHAAQVVDIRCEAPDPELLLAEWLNALIYEMAVRGWLFGRFDVTIDAGRLHARAWGEPVDRARHAPAVEIKGATYTGLSVRQESDGLWYARCVLDV